MDNPDHDFYRRMLTGSFSAGRMNQLRPEVQRIVDSAIDNMIDAGPPADLVPDFAQPVPSSLICLLLGIGYDDHDYFQTCSRKLISQRTTRDEAILASAGIQEVVSRAVNRNVESPGDDIIGRLVVDQLRTGRLSYDEVVSMGHELLLAGHGTTASAISLGILALLDSPEQVEQLRGSDDPRLIRRAVEETLRYTSIAHIGRRRICTGDIEVGGVLIAAGEGVVLPDLVSNRDDRVFPDADRLDVDRESTPHMAFGYGIHACLGQPLARLIMQVAFGTIFKRLPGLALAIPLDGVPYIYDTNILSVASLKVTWL